MPTIPEEFAAQMQEIKETVGRYKDEAHEQMDNLLVKVLVELGYQDGITIYNSQRKWYD